MPYHDAKAVRRETVEQEMEYQHKNVTMLYSERYLELAIKQACDEGYNKGYDDGYDDGYEEGMDVDLYGP